MPFITPTGWARVQGYPKIQGSDAGATLVDQFESLWDLTDIFIKLPPSNSAYDQESVSVELADLKLSTYTIDPTGSKNHAMITLNYQPSDALVAAEEDIPEFFLENGTLEKALEKHPAYLMNWNYTLWEFIKTTEEPSELPKWAAIATTPVNASGQAKENEYAWSKDKPGGGYVKGSDAYDWIKVQDKTKPGVESFIVPSPVVQERKYYRSKKKAESAGSTVGILQAPEEDFGIENGEWLVMSATVQKENRRYLVERSFQYADDWDEDLYGEEEEE